jgi:hypothetical protein
MGGVVGVADGSGLTIGLSGSSPNIEFHTLICVILCFLVDRLCRILTNPTSGGGLMKVVSTRT